MICKKAKECNAVTFCPTCRSREGQKPINLDETMLVEAGEEVIRERSALRLGFRCEIGQAQHWESLRWLMTSLSSGTFMSEISAISRGWIKAQIHKNAQGSR
jgi:hypothetical protein